MKKFMTYFEEITSFFGYTQELNICILGSLFDNAPPYQIYASYKAYDLNENFISEFRKVFFFLEDQILKLPANHFASLPSNISIVPNGTRFFYVDIEAQQNTNKIVIARKRVNICKPSSECVPLRWLNNLGGWDFFAFEGILEYSQSNEQLTFRKYASRNDSVIYAPSKFSLKVSCNENINDKNIEGIASLLTSREVYWQDIDSRMFRYRPQKSIPFVPVLVKNGNIIISEGRSGTYEVSFEVTISEQNT